MTMDRKKTSFNIPPATHERLRKLAQRHTGAMSRELDWLSVLGEVVLDATESDREIIERIVAERMVAERELAEKQQMDELTEVFMERAKHRKDDTQ